MKSTEIGALDRFISPDVILLLGRVLFSLIFIWSGWAKITGFSGTAGYMGQLGVPLPSVALIIEIILEFGGGLALFLGVFVRLASLGLIVHTVLVSLFVHTFWSVPPDQALEQIIQFMKNVTIVGGLLYINVQGAGGLSLSRILRRT